MLTLHAVPGLWRALLLVMSVCVLIVQAQEPVSPRYIPCGAGAVAVCDLQTGLMWETKTEALAGGSGPCTAPAALHGVDLICTVGDAQASWLPALNAEGGTGYAGYTDWRMPGVQELVTILDFDTRSIDPVFGPTAMEPPPGRSVPGLYISSTLNVRASGPSFQSYWFVSFDDEGGGQVSSISNAQYVRAVRGGSTPADMPGEGDPVSPRYIPCGAGEVAICDLQTGLMWERKAGFGADCLADLHSNSARCTHEEALGPWIAALNAEDGTGYAGYVDWRLPTIQELITIMDYTLNNTDPVFGPTAISAYWSSTPSGQLEGSDTAWVLRFGGTLLDGVTQGMTTTAQLPVRAVRGGR